MTQDEREQVVRRIAREHRVRRRTAERWFDELVKFLDACAESATPLTPSKKVDKAWHELILHTRAYEAFCLERYGELIHHDPYERPAPGGYRQTYATLTSRHGDLDRKVWPSPFRGGYAGAGGAGCGALFGGGGGGDGGGDGGGGGCGGGGG